MSSPNALTRWLARAPAAAFSAYAITAAFATYFCMYAYRKAFAAGTFRGTVHIPLLPPLDLKTFFIIAQVLGYCASKFLGIKVVSEMPPARRAWAILVCIGAAELALGLFGCVPAPWSALCMLVNGLSLGMVWGFVFGFLEGRQVSDLLGAGLCTSFIVASGFVKTAGKIVLGWGIAEHWMPFVTGALFFPPLLLSVWMLAQLPPPSPLDEALRTRRAPMDAPSRRAFFRAHAPGLLALIALYIMLTAYRDFRDNFARELWDALGYGDQPAILTISEIPVAIGSLLAIALMMTVRDNRKALMAIHGIMLAGALLIGTSTLLYHAGMLSPVYWMIGVGLGLYVGYVPFNCVLFDRLIAAAGSVATAGFLIYVADAFGYLGSVALLLYKNFGHAKLSWLEFFLQSSYATAVVCGVLYWVSGAYFWARTRPVEAEARAATA
jgi:hypothetical protein